MGVSHTGDTGLNQEIKALWRAIRRISKATLQNSSIGRAVLRFYAGGRIVIEDGGGIDILSSGYLNIDGDLTGVGEFNWEGPWELAGDGVISGDVDGTGVLDWTGTAYFKGPTGIQGNFAVSGDSTLTGPVALNSTLTVGSGQIKAGAVTVTPTGGGAVKVGNITIDGDLGGTISSSGTVYIQGSGATSVRVTGLLSASDILTLGKITAGELDVVGPKNFRMDHPSKPGHWLRHGSTESPVSGIEYWGEGVIEADGSVFVDLPEYFEALAKPANRTVFVTGRGHSPDWSDIEDGSFTVTGKPGGRSSWLVKAERFGGDFLLEEEIPSDRVEGVGEAV